MPTSKPNDQAGRERHDARVDEQVAATLIEQDDVLLYLRGDVGQRLGGQRGLVAEDEVLADPETGVAPVPGGAVAGRAT